MMMVILLRSCLQIFFFVEGYSFLAMQLEDFFFNFRICFQFICKRYENQTLKRNPIWQVENCNGIECAYRIQLHKFCWSLTLKKVNLPIAGNAHFCHLYANGSMPRRQPEKTDNEAHFLQKGSLKWFLAMLPGHLEKTWFKRGDVESGGGH